MSPVLPAPARKSRQVRSWRQHFGAVFKPRERLTVSQHAALYRRIAPGTGPEPGPWRNERTPYAVEPMDCFSDGVTETVVCMWGSQLAKTEIITNVNVYFSHHDPAPILNVQPTIEAAEAYVKERLDPTFKHSPALAGIYEESPDETKSASRKKSNTIRLKLFAGGSNAFVGANAPAGLASRPRRVALCDEPDRYVITREGNAVKLTFQRTANFWNRKRGLFSTPTNAGASLIEEWFLRSDQRFYWVPCPHCGAMQRLEWGRMRWKKDAAGAGLAESAWYECAHCAGKIEEHHKAEMLTGGRWIASAPFNKIAGFQLSAIYSPWATWAELVAEWLDILASRDPDAEREFTNLRLGLPYAKDQTKIDVDAIFERRRHAYGDKLPVGVKALTCGVDTQPDRLELEIVGWGAGCESWGVQYRTLWGDPNGPQVWADLDAVLAQRFERVDGAVLGVLCTCVDSGGVNTDAVYKACRAREAARVYAIKGRGGADVPRVSRGNRLQPPRPPALLFTLGVDQIKTSVLGRVAIDSPGPGFCHFPTEAAAGYDSAYFKGLLSEIQRPERRSGLTVLKWVKIHDRNEPLDIRDYATAALEIVRPNLDDAPLPGAAGPAPRRQRGRRVLSKGVE